MPKKIQPDFVGESRIKLVEGLLSILDQVDKSGQSQWVSLEAPSGWGKTRIAQELYARLATRDEQLYWPPSILDATDAELFDVAYRRKRVFPDPSFFNRESGSLPDFMWWGIACEMRNGVPSQVLLEDRQQLEVHQIYMQQAWLKLVSYREKHGSVFSDAKQGTINFVKDRFKAGIFKTIGEFAEVYTPGVGAAYKMGHWTYDKTKTYRQNKRKIQASGSLDEGDTLIDLIDETVLMVTEYAKQGLPMIVFVEDFHKATPLMEELIDRLVRLNAAILIITTSWPGELDTSKRLTELFSNEVLKKRILRIQHDKANLPEQFPMGASMGEMPQDALRTLISAYYPDVDPETQNRLAARYNNPLPLELVCTLPKYKNRFAEGNLTLSAAEIDKLPQRVEDLYRELWHSLPEEAQRVLALSSLAIPDKNTTWHKQLVQSAITQLAKIDQDHIPHGWVRNIEQWLSRFNEPDQLQIARKYVDDTFVQEEIDLYLEQLAAELKIRLLNAEGKEAQHCAYLTLALHKKNKTDDNQALKAIRILQDALREMPLEFSTLIELGKLLDKLTIDKNSLDRLIAQLCFARTLGQSGQVEAALQKSETLLQSQRCILEPDATDTLITRHEIAFWLAKSGQVKPALQKFEALLEDQLRTLGPDSLDTLQTRSNIVSQLVQSGQVDLALEKFETLLQDQLRILGSDALDTLKTRSNIASQLAKSGQLKLALEKFEALLQSQLCILGSDAPDTLKTCSNIAYWLAESGQIELALEKFETLLEDQLRILGADAPDTLITRNNIAFWLAKSGQIEFALQKSETLLQDQLRILGSDAWDTLRTRSNIAFWLAKLGKIELALKKFEYLLQNQHRILGIDSPDTLVTRSHIAFWLAKSGQIETALQKSETLLQDQLRILGPGTLDTQITRSNIASWLAKSGQIETALQKFETLLQDQLHILGPDAPDTLNTRNNIARWLAISGQADLALKKFEALLQDQFRIQGSGNPKLLDIHHNIAYCLMELGQMDAASKQYEKLLQEQLLFLEPDDPELEITRNNIAYCLQNKQ